MFAEDTTFCFALPGQNATVELSAEAVRSLLTQIETELHRSEVFRRAIQGLEASQQDGASGAQFLLKAVGREAIRLALRQFVRQQPTETQAVTEMESRESVSLEQQKAQAAEAFESQIVNLVPGWRKRLGADQKAEQAEQERQLCLQRLGEQIRRAREARSLSLRELHGKTMVPLHQLQAIEAGQGSHLPEDIYLRGFIRRIASALDLNAERLLDLLPPTDPVKAVLPTWYHPPTKSTATGFGFSGLSIRPMHLYVGYAALIAGGFAWLSHQPAPKPLPNAIDLDSPRIQKSDEKTQATQTQATVKASIAAPERL